MVYNYVSFRLSVTLWYSINQSINHFFCNRPMVHIKEEIIDSKNI